MSYWEECKADVLERLLSSDDEEGEEEAALESWMAILPELFVPVPAMRLLHKGHKVKRGYGKGRVRKHYGLTFEGKKLASPSRWHRAWLLKNGG